MPTVTSALDTQIGGDHYKKYPIQPVEYAHVNGMLVCEANVLKYITRHKEKGKAEDIHKAINLLVMLLELEYPEEKETWLKTSIR